MSALVIAQAGADEHARLLRDGGGGVRYGVGADDTSSTTSVDSDLDHNTPHVPLKHGMSTARLVIVCLGIWSSNFAFAVQGTAIPTLAPTISSHFNHAELAAYLGSVFGLANTAGIPVYGVLIDTLGRRFAMLVACGLFGVGTVACALAPGMYALIAARGVAGLGGGGLLAVSAVICTDLVDLRERGFYQGIMMTIFGIGSTLGGPLSGYLADHYGWQWSFWVQVPIILWCAAIVILFLPEPPTPPTHKSAIKGLLSLDWAGTGLLVATISALILGLSLHTSYFYAWSDVRVSGLLVASVLGLLAFVRVEARADRPIIPLSLFHSRQLVALWISSALISSVNLGFQFQIPTFFSVLADAPAAEAGLVVSICSGIGLSTGTLLAGYHIRRGGGYITLGRAAVVVIIIAPLVAAKWLPSWPWWSFYATAAPASWGYATFLCVSLIALISSVDRHTMPKATALLYTVRSLGATLGVSLGGSVQVGVLVSGLAKRFKGLPNSEGIINAIVHSKEAIKDLPSNQRALALDAYAVSISVVWVACAGVAVLTLLAALFIRQNDIHGKGKAGDGEDEES